MPGLGLTRGIRSGLSWEMMRAMVVRSLPELSGLYSEVLDKVASASGSDYVAAARAKTQATGHLHFPVTNLANDSTQLTIHDKSASSTKMLRHTYDKRVLERAYADGNYLPSFPFGTRPQDLSARFEDNPREFLSDDSE